MRKIGLALVASALMAFGQAQAQEVLTIGVRSEASTLDPHWTQLSADLQVQEHIFEHLVDLDSNSQPAPGLAVSWAPIDETTWEFKLREGVTWHDGEAFNADDVIFSFDRLRAGHRRRAGEPGLPARQGRQELDEGGRLHRPHHDRRPVPDHGRGPRHAPDRGRARIARQGRLGRLQLGRGRHRHRTLHVRGVQPRQPHHGRRRTPTGGAAIPAGIR